MRSILNTACAGTAAPTRIICLPGVYHSAKDFLAAGFEGSVRRRSLPIDLLFCDLEMQHLGDRGALDRLQDEIVRPARDLGCRSIWIAGISLGGLIALDYAATHPGEVDGLCLLAPYLGNRALTAEIARASGLGAWAAAGQNGDAHAAGEDPDDSVAHCDEERRIWHFIQAQDVNSQLLYLGFGQDDRFADAHRLMAQALPPHAVDIVPGGHDWRTWKVLWENFLDARFA